MNNFRDLNVWKKSVTLATIIYNETDKFLKSERYGFTSQIRRSVVSISSNIAEGAGRSSVKGFRQFLNVLIGSCYELETQLTISRNLGFIEESQYQSTKEKAI